MESSQRVDFLSFTMSPPADITQASSLVSMTLPAESPASVCNSTDYLGDVFSDSPPSSLRAPTPPLSSHAQLQAAHHTAGYRDGISAGKESSLQSGFDEGYPLGADMGRRAGRMMGILEACLTALIGPASSREEASKSQVDMNMESRNLFLLEITALHDRASKELRLEQLLTAEYFDENGVWKYSVSADSEDENFTFKEVVGEHPVMKEWEEIIQSLLDRIGVRIEASGEEVNGEADED